MSMLSETCKELFPAKITFKEKDYPDLSGKTFLITGTSAGIGKSTVGLLLQQNATVITVNRNLEKNEKAVESTISELCKKNPSLDPSSLKKNLFSVQADLMDLSTIKPAVEKIQSQFPQVDTLLLNAGIMHPADGSKSVQGYEAQFGTNVMGHQLLLDLVTPLLQKSADRGSVPRVLFLSSFGHYSAPPNGGMTWNFKDASKASSQMIYGQSKAGNLYQFSEFARKHPDMLSIAVHPGTLNTDLSRNWNPMVLAVAKYFVAPAINGAYTEMFAALSPTFTLKDSGKAYIGPGGVARKMRKDIELGCEDGTAKKMVDWVEGEIAAYK